MSDQENKMDQENNEKRDLALDTLLKEKHDRERLERWKAIMPIPEEKPKSNRVAMIVSLLIIGLLLSILGYFSLEQKKPVHIAENLIKSTTITSLDDLNERGSNTSQISKEALAYYKAVKLLKTEQSNSFEAIELLTDLTTKKNKYQIEAIWFKALAHIKIGDHKNARIELEKLSTLSNYQEKNAAKLLNILK